METVSNNKFIKPSEFETPRHIKVLDFKRLRAMEAGSKYGDKYGMTNRLTIHDYQTQSDKILEVTSYLFLRDIKGSGVVSGDECIAFCIELQDPNNAVIKPRRWLFHRLINKKPDGDITNN